jgi:uncharacterized YccA/Bax inhibitor family protein
MANPVLERQFSDQAAADAALQSGAPTELESGHGRMTIGSVLMATSVLLILVGAGAAYGWANAIAVQRWYWLMVIGLLVLVFLTVARPRVAPITGAIYSLAQGAFIGSISRVYEEFYDGIVFLALIATLSVFVAMLFLYATRIIKVTEKARSVIIIATVGIGLFYLVSFILSLFSVSVPLITGTSTPALVFSILVVVAAALNLLLDFQVIESGINRGAPKAYAWFAAFGLMVTIVWLYIEMLRLLAIIAARRS